MGIVSGALNRWPANVTQCAAAASGEPGALLSKSHGGTVTRWKRRPAELENPASPQAPQARMPPTQSPSANTNGLPLSTGACTTAVAACIPLHVAYLNLRNSTERAKAMEAMLQSAQALASQPTCPFTYERVEAIQPRCQRGAACRFNGGRRGGDGLSGLWDEYQVYHQYERGATKKFADERRAGALGVWLSHLGLWTRLARADGLSSSSSGSAAALLLILEDDAWVSPTLLRSMLPCLIPSLPQPWHALRFSTWGRTFDEDRITLGDGRTHIFHAREGHAYDSHNGGYAAFPYGGTHAYLVQRETVGALLEYAKGRGAMAIDIAMREPRPVPTEPSDARAAGASPRADIVSLVLQTPLVGVRPKSGSWRRPSPTTNK